MDGPTAFYIVVFIAVLNVIAFSSVNDWKAVVFMALAAGATYAVSPDQTLALVVGIVASNLYRASSSMQEGMTENKKKQDAKKKKMDYEMEPEAAPETPDPAAVEEVDPIESMVKNMDIKGMLAKQSELMEGIKSMGPLMAKGNEMIANLPKGFLKQAMNNMKLKK
jgi:hypothetical protein